MRSQRFVKAILDPRRAAPFLDAFLPFQARVAELGIYNSLAQLLIKITAPGIPDFYQGTELWDLNLVDPDNRRPVDYARRRADPGTLMSARDGDDGATGGGTAGSSGTTAGSRCSSWHGRSPHAGASAMRSRVNICRSRPPARGATRCSRSRARRGSGYADHVRAPAHRVRDP